MRGPQQATVSERCGQFATAALSSSVKLATTSAGVIKATRRALHSRQ